MFTLGVTGGVGSGKSLVCDHLKTKGVHIVDADIVAREVVTPGSQALSSIEQRFGHHILQPNGELDRKILRRLVFERTSDKVWLESLLHPLIRERVSTSLQSPKNCPYQAYVAPLLLESGQRSTVDKVLVVDCPEELQIARASQRDGVSIAGIQKIMSSQLSRNERLRQADFVLDNSGEIEYTLRQLDELHSQIIKLTYDPED